jgi:hemerythrin
MPFLDPLLLPELPLAFENDDHQSEARLLNDAIDAVEAYRDGRFSAEDVLQRLDALRILEREHFAREEAAMRECGYPAYAVHRQEHERVLADRRFEAERFRLGRGAGRLLAYLTETVPVWLLGHLQTMDLHAARFVVASAGEGAQT